MKVIVFGALMAYGLYLIVRELFGIPEDFDVDLSDIDLDDEDENLGI